MVQEFLINVPLKVNDTVNVWEVMPLFYFQTIFLGSFKLSCIVWHMKPDSLFYELYFLTIILLKIDKLNCSVKTNYIDQKRKEKTQMRFDPSAHRMVEI